MADALAAVLLEDRLEHRKNWHCVRMSHEGLRGTFSHVSHILQGFDHKVMHFFVIARVAVPGHRLEQSIKVLIILHAVQQTSFHYRVFYLLFVHARLHRPLPSVRPVPLNDVGEE